MSIFKRLSQKVIPYINRPNELDGLHLARTPVLFIEGGELAELDDLLAPLAEAPMKQTSAFLHVDFVEGMSRDKAAINYLRRYRALHGIISVKARMIEEAQRQGFGTVLRVFLQDTRALERGLELARKVKPDALELLPAMAAIANADLFEDLTMPCIVGGLVRDRATVEAALAAGFEAVSASHRSIWDPPERG